MLESLKIKGFRKYKELDIEGFGSVNFILGDNNIGKTSILEAIFAWACGQNINPLLSIPLARGRYNGIQNPYWVMEELLATVYNRHELPLKMSFEGIFDGTIQCFDHTIYPSELLTEFDVSYKIPMEKIVPKFNDSNSRDSGTGLFGTNSLINPILVARWEVTHNNETIQTEITIPQMQTPNIKPFQSTKYIDIFSHISVSEMVQMYASLKREKRIQEVVEEMQKVFPEITGFDMIPYPDGSQAPVSVLKKDGSILPLYAFGDGVQKWFYALGALSIYKQSIICIDEIDTSLHPKAQGDFSVSLVRSAIKNNAQLFLTTHNIEFMDQFLNSISEQEKSLEEEIRIITLRSYNGEIKSRNISAAKAKNARELYNLELR